MVGACNFVPVPVIQRPAPAHGASGPVFVMSEGHGSIRQALDLKWDHRSHQIFRFYPPVLLADHSNKLSVPTQRQDLRCPPFERGRVMRLLVSCIASPGTLRSQLNSTQLMPNRGTGDAFQSGNLFLLEVTKIQQRIKISPRLTGKRGLITETGFGGWGHEGGS